MYDSSPNRLNQADPPQTNLTESRSLPPATSGLDWVFWNPRDCFGLLDSLKGIEHTVKIAIEGNSRISFPFKCPARESSIHLGSLAMETCRLKDGGFSQVGKAVARPQGRCSP